MTPAELRDRLIARLCALGLVSVGDAPFVACATLRARGMVVGGCP